MAASVTVRERHPWHLVLLLVAAWIVSFFDCGNLAVAAPALVHEMASLLETGTAFVGGLPKYRTHRVHERRTRKARGCVLAFDLSVETNIGGDPPEGAGTKLAPERRGVPQSARRLKPLAPRTLR